MTRRRLAVVTAGLRQPSSTRLLSDRLTEATRHALAARGIEPHTDIVEVRDHAHDLTNNLMTGFAGEQLQAATSAVTGADGLVAVTPIFSASYSGLFKTFFDVLDADALTGMPVLIAATGGTARHSLALDHALRPLFTYLRAIVVPTGVYAASEDWGTGASAQGGALVERIERAAGELADLIAAREPRRQADPFADTPSFEQLLAGG